MIVNLTSNPSRTRNYAVPYEFIASLIHRQSGRERESKIPEALIIISRTKSEP